MICLVPIFENCFSVLKNKNKENKKNVFSSQFFCSKKHKEHKNSVFNVFKNCSQEQF